MAANSELTSATNTYKYTEIDRKRITDNGQTRDIRRVKTVTNQDAPIVTFEYLDSNNRWVVDTTDESEKVWNSDLLSRLQKLQTSNPSNLTQDTVRTFSNLLSTVNHKETDIQTHLDTINNNSDLSARLEALKQLTTCDIPEVSQLATKANRIFDSQAGDLNQALEEFISLAERLSAPRYFRHPIYYRPLLAWSPWV